MTDATTADIIAAEEVASKYKLAVWHAETWVCAGLMRHGYGKTRAEAVKDWAMDRAPWPAPKVVPMWAYIGNESHEVCTVVETAEYLADTDGGTVVPCEVVIRNKTEGV